MKLFLGNAGKVPPSGLEAHSNKGPARWIAAFLVAIWTVLQAGPAQGQELLRWGFEPGDTWVYRVTESQSIESNPLRSPESGQLTGQPVRMTQRQMSTIEASVGAPEANGNIAVDWTHTRAQVSVDAIEASLDWDSDDPADDLDPAFEAAIGSIRARIGQTLTVVMSPRGEIVEVRGVDAIIDAIIASVGSDLDAAALPLVRRQLESMFGPEQIGSEFLGGLGVLPEEPMTVDASWLSQARLQSPLAPELGPSETRHTIEGFDDRSGERVARIRHEGLIGGLDEVSRALPSAFSLNDATVFGETEFSLTRGLILQSSKTSEFAVTVRSPEGVRQRIRSENTTSLEIIEP